MNNFTFFEDCYIDKLDSTVVGKIEGKLYNWGQIKQIMDGSNQELDETDINVLNFLKKDDKLNTNYTPEGEENAK